MHTDSSWQEQLREGLGLCRSRDFDKALQRFQNAYEIAPKRPETACALGREYMRRGKAEEARSLLQAAWDVDHSLLSAGTSLARVLGLDLQNFTEAHKILDEVDQSHRDSLSPLIRGELLLAQGRHEEAAIIAQSLQDSAQEEEEDSVAKKGARLLLSRIENERGLCAAKNGSYERAIFSFKRASDLAEDWAAPLSNLGAAFENLGKWKRAEHAYTSAVEFEPHYANAWHNLALLYKRKHDSRAFACFQRAYYCEHSNPEFIADYLVALSNPPLTEDTQEEVSDVFQHYIEYSQTQHPHRTLVERDLGALETQLRLRGARPIAQQLLHFFRKDSQEQF